MTRLLLSFFGSYDVRLNGAKVTGFRSDKARALLAYLAVESDRPHLRPRLAGLLWPDYGESSALAYLRRELFNLREILTDRDLPAPALAVQGDSVQFDTGCDCSCDVVELQAAMRAVGDRMAGADALERLARAVERYRGSFLEGFHLDDSDLYEEWSLLTRERLHMQALDALSRLADYHAAQGEAARATASARRLVALEPEREESHRQLMRLLAQNGRRSDALVQYESLREVLQRSLQVEPDDETMVLVEQIRRGDFARSDEKEDVSLPVWVVASKHNLPAQPTALVGRAQELEHIAGLLVNPACRLLTLVGVGGVGKTRLALAAAEQRINDFPGGVWVVQLASVSSPDLLATAIMESLQVARYGNASPEEQLLRYVRDQEMLLVLDNFEHLMDGASLVARLLEAGAGLKLLVTSRERLRFRAEWAYTVEGLRLPEATEVPRGEGFALMAEAVTRAGAGSAPVPDVLARSDAISLFIQSAQRMEPSFSLGRDNAAAIWRICRSVEGMPLGIELAAGWTRLLSCDAIADRLTGSLDALQTQTRDAPVRQQSLHAVFEHSWRLLPPAERRVLVQLGVFRDGFDLAAAQAVAGAGLQEIGGLLDKSWLRVIEGRYELHELARQFALKKLASGDEDLPADLEGQAAARRHSVYYSELLWRLSPDLWTGAQLLAAATILAEIGNVQAGWRWAVQNSAARLIDGYLDALTWMSWYRGWFSEIARALAGAVTSLRAAAADPVSTSEVVRREIRRTLLRVLYIRVREEAGWALPPGKTASSWAEFFDFWRGDGAGLFTDAEEMLARISFGRWLADAAEPRDLAEALRLGEAALAFFLSRDDVLGGLKAADLVCVVQIRRGRYPEARQAMLQGLAGAERVGERIEAEALRIELANGLRASGDLVAARRVYDRAVAFGRETAIQAQLFHGLFRSGECSLACGEYDRARREFTESLELAEKLGQSHMAMGARRGLAEVSCAEGDCEAARRILAGALEMARASGAYPDHDDVRVTLGRVECALGRNAEAAALLSEALTVSEQLQTVNHRTKALAAIAELLYATDQLDSAATIAAFLDNAPEADYMAKRGAGEVLSTLALGMNAAARAAGREMTLDACDALARHELSALSSGTVTP